MGRKSNIRSKADKQAVIGNDYLTKELGYASRYARNAYTANMRYLLHFYGTDVSVRRSRETEEKKAIGSAYIFDDTEVHGGVETFQKRVILQRSTTNNKFKSTEDELEAWTDEEFYEMGDQIEFVASGVQYRYKVVNIETFDPPMNIMHKLTLSGFEEHRITEQPKSGEEFVVDTPDDSVIF